MSREKTRNKSAGSLIKELRKTLDLTLSEFSEELAIDRQTLHRYEVGTLRCPLPLLHQLLGRSVGNGDKYALAAGLATAVANETRLTAFSVLVSALATIEGSEAPRHISRLGKRAAEILKVE